MNRCLKVFTTSVICLSTGCASVTTKSPFDGEKPLPVKVVYDKCIVRVGMAFFLHGHETASIAPDNASKFSSEQEHAFGDAIKDQLLSRGICKNVYREEVTEHAFKASFSLGEVTPELEKENYDPQALTISYYQARLVWLDNWAFPLFAVELIAYLGTLGLIPMAMPFDDHYWVTIKKPHSEKLEALDLPNDYWVWFWTPFYLKSGSAASRTDLQKRDTQRTTDLITHQLNAL